jgi:hypothetical protein
MRKSKAPSPLRFAGALQISVLDTADSIWLNAFAITS